jgi:hypothetical protein
MVKDFNISAAVEAAASIPEKFSVLFCLIRRISNFA